MKTSLVITPNEGGVHLFNIGSFMSMGKTNRGGNEQDYLRNEFIQLVLKAKQIYKPEKKKKKGRRRSGE